MMVTLEPGDLSKLSAGARKEIAALLSMGEASRAAGAVVTAPEMGAEYKDFDMEDVADLTFRDVQTWMESASDKTKLGLKTIAQNGGIVRARQLTDAGIDNLPHFQSRTTVRTRTVTSDKNAFLLGWDDWEAVPDGEGRYAVTPITSQSLRRYFKLG